MTIEEKREAVRTHCYKTACHDCIIVRVLGAPMGCLSDDPVTIERNYGIIFGGGAFPDPSAQPDNVQRHESICRELNALYARKNADYGDSFHKTFLEEGMAMARIRLSDKLERFKRLTKSNEQHVQDESVRDTLIDLANYAIMTVMELDGEKE